MTSLGCAFFFLLLVFCFVCAAAMIWCIGETFKDIIQYVCAEKMIVMETVLGSCNRLQLIVGIGFLFKMSF